MSRRGWQNPPLPLAPRKTGRLTENVMDCIDAFSIIRRRTAEAGFKLGCHVFRGTGITEYLEKGGTLELLS